MLTDATRNRDFPSLADMTYLNTAAEGIPPLVVKDAVSRYMSDKRLGMDGRVAHHAALDAAKAALARAYGMSEDEVGICSCSSEAYNLACAAMRFRTGDEVVINDLEYPAGATPWMHPDCPADVKLWRAHDWALRVDDLVPLLGPNTRLVTMSLVSFFNGFKVALDEVVDAVRLHSPALISVDVTQALGRIPLDLSRIDLVISSTHKWICATHGGGLVGVPTCRAQELTVPAGGWFNLEDPFGPDRFDRMINKPGAASFTAGMPNFPAIYAIRAALEYVENIGVRNIYDHAQPLVEQFISELRRLPVELITPMPANAHAGIVAFRHEHTGRINKYLHDNGVHIMEHAGRLRVAIHGYNTSADIDHLTRTLKEALDHV
jgi:cysteine desulfurase/selenocysteine lyase